jgi:AsmA protein
MVTARLALGKLDLNPYLPPENRSAHSAGAAKPKAGAPAKPKAATPAAKPTSSDWSDDPIDLSALKSINADLDLTVEGIVFRKIKIGESHLKIALKSGVMVSNLTRMSLYGGNGKAKVTADASRKLPAVALTFDLTKFQANPFMSDAMDFDHVEGTANADLAVTARGRTQREMISALNGSGKVQFLDGAVRGINLAAMARNIKTAFLDSGARQAQKTDFAELRGTYRINNGILTNNDLTLKSPLIRLTGKGTVDLPKRRVNYRVEPKLVETTKGQGGRADASGIKVPVVVSGPWDNLSYKPDLAAEIGDIAKDPDKALKSLRKLIPGLSDTGTGSTTQGSGSPPSIKDAERMLKKLFGR